jgi:hypothetical protein
VNAHAGAPESSIIRSLRSPVSWTSLRGLTQDWSVVSSRNCLHSYWRVASAASMRFICGSVIRPFRIVWKRGWLAPEKMYCQR